MNVPALLPVIPSPLAESSAAALEWPRLRDHIAARTVSPLGRGLDAGARTLRRPRLDRPAAAAHRRDAHHARPRRQLRASAASSIPPYCSRKPASTALRSSPSRSATCSTSSNASPPGAISLSPPPNATRYDWPGIAELSSPLLDHDLAPLLRLLRGKIEPDGSLNDDASPELRRIRRAMERQHRAIEESLRKSLRDLTEGGSTQEELITIRGDRFVIPVKAEFKRKVPGVIHGSSSSGQTVFVEPLETIEQNNELVRLLDEEQSEIHRILVAMTRALGENADGDPAWHVHPRRGRIPLRPGPLRQRPELRPPRLHRGTLPHRGASSSAGAPHARGERPQPATKHRLLFRSPSRFRSTRGSSSSAARTPAARPCRSRPSGCWR